MNKVVLKSSFTALSQLKISEILRTFALSNILLKMLLFPNAKINIGLNIVEQRPDGYHNIETVFYPISLCDRLTIKQVNKIRDYRLSTQGIAIDGQPEDNLLIKTYKLFQERFSITGLDILLKKNIPFGAGLGGGSSDAASMAMALNQLFHLQLSDDELMKIVAPLGADCPFFIHNQPVFAEGIGNRFSPVNIDLKGWYLIMVKPNVHVSTSAAYEGISPQKPTCKINEILETKPVEEWRYYIKNDFEESVFKQYPWIREAKEKLYQMGAVYAAMSGSGSSVYGLFRTNPKKGNQFGSYFTFCQTL